MKIQIENLRAQMRGVELNSYQRALALDEYYKLLDYVEELEQLAVPAVSGSLPSLDDATKVAIRISEEAIKPPLDAKEQAIFIAGFQECIKWLNVVFSSAKRKVCPVCKKSFEKGWGEFCSQDCWDTDM